MADVTKETLDALAARLTEVEGYLHIDERRGDVANLEAASAAPGFWDDTPVTSWPVLPPQRTTWPA